jgi:ribosome-binding protein aMBF1 (putative translation factor)
MTKAGSTEGNGKDKAKGKEKVKAKGKEKDKVKAKAKAKSKEMEIKAQDVKEEASIHFDCEFTTPVRMLFRQKRETLGLAYSSLAQIFVVNWSTVRKWEIGRTRYCNIRLRPIIEDYLNGKLDDLLIHCQREKLSRQSMPRNLTPKVANVLEKIENTYRLCINYPDLCEQLRKSLDELSVVMLKKLLDIHKK